MTASTPGRCRTRSPSISEATISPAAKSGIAAASGVGSRLAVGGGGVGLTVGAGVAAGLGVGDGVAVSSGGRVQAASRPAATAAHVARIPPENLIGQRVAGGVGRRAGKRQEPASVGTLAASIWAISRAFVVP